MTPPPGRPRVVLTTVASVDARIAPSRRERLLDGGVYARWIAAWPPDVHQLIQQRDQWLADRYSPTVTVEGSGSFVDDLAVSPWPGTSSRGSVPDHLPRSTPRWFVVIDSRGRIDWRFTGDEETALLVLVCERTPGGYLARLRELRVGYLVAGRDRVDLSLALVRLRDTLGADTVIADGGGALNGAMVRAGLLDELHVITFPALVGGLDTPSILDGPSLTPGLPIPRLNVAHRVEGSAGSTWTRYEVAASGA